MRGWDAGRVAQAAGAELIRPGAAAAGGPGRVVIDSREAGPGDLFVGLHGERADGGAFASEVLRAGAWGVLVGPEHVRATVSEQAPETGGAVLSAADPLASLGALGRGWRRELGARVVAITGSTGKTSTKDILRTLLEPHLRTHASRENFNTEIGMPLAILEAPPGTEALVLELAMRGAGQIAELTEICEPDVGVIVNVGPVHVELLGSLEAIVAAKAELLAGMRAGATAVLPASEPLLAAHRREDLETVLFGEGSEGGDVRLVRADGGHVVIDASGERIELEVSFSQAFNLTNLLAAVAAARALGVAPSGRLDVAFSAMRGERIELGDGVLVINDCYNANPMSMLAALDDLAATAPARRVAVLGDMLELGEQASAYHEAVGEQAAQRGVELLVTVGPLAAAMAAPFGGEAHRTAGAEEAAGLVQGLVRPGDTILVKASRGVGLEAVTESLRGS